MCQVKTQEYAILLAWKFRTLISCHDIEKYFEMKGKLNIQGS